MYGCAARPRRPSVSPASSSWAAWRLEQPWASSSSPAACWPRWRVRRSWWGVQRVDRRVKLALGGCLSLLGPLAAGWRMVCLVTCPPSTATPDAPQAARARPTSKRRCRTLASTARRWRCWASLCERCGVGAWHGIVVVIQTGLKPLVPAAGCWCRLAMAAHLLSRSPLGQPCSGLCHVVPPPAVAWLIVPGTAVTCLRHAHFTPLLV